MPDILDKTQTTSVSQTDSAIYVVNSRTTSPVDRWETPGDFHKNRTGNDSVLAFASLSAAITAIGATEATLEIPATTTVSSSLTIPSNVTLCFMGPGQISVASGQQLVIHGSIQAPIRQIFSGTGTVKGGGRTCDAFSEWFGATGNNSTDDAAAIQKAIDFFKDTGVQHHPGRVHLIGGYAIGSTLLVTGNSVRLIGSGWGVQNDDPYRGFIRWIGSAGSPMIKITECWGSGVEYLRIIGKSTAKPTAAIEFASVNTAHGLDFSFLHHIYIGHMYGYDTDNAVQFDNGILFSGTVDGDANKFEHIVVVGATTGINVDNANAADSHWDSLFIQNCTTGFKCSAFVVGTNWFFALNAVDIDMHGAGGRLDLRHIGSEGSGRLATLTGASAAAVKLMIRGGSWQCDDAFSVADSGGDRWIIDAQTSYTQYIHLEDFQWFGSGSNFKNPVIRIGTNGAAGDSLLRLDNTNFGKKNIKVVESGTTVRSYASVEMLTRIPTGQSTPMFSRVILDPNRAEDRTFQVFRHDFTGKVGTYGGPLKVKRLAAPANVAATNAVGSGATSYSYKVVAHTHDGTTLPSSAATCTNGTLGVSNKNLITWDQVVGAYAYSVYGRTSGSELLLITLDADDMASGFQWAYDDGTLTPSGALPTTNTTGNLTIEGQAGLEGLVTLTPTPGSGLTWQVITTESGSSGLLMKGNGPTGNSPQFQIFPDAHGFKGMYFEAGVASGSDILFRDAPGGTTALKIKQGNGSLEVNRTITAGGTTGNQTINKTAGTVNIAAAGTTVTVTNSLVNTSSIVLCVLRTNDATARIANVVPGSGSFVINLTAAATAEVSIGFVVLN